MHLISRRFRYSSFLDTNPGRVNIAKTLLRSQGTRSLRAAQLLMIEGLLYSCGQYSLNRSIVDLIFYFDALTLVFNATDYAIAMLAVVYSGSGPALELIANHMELPDHR